MANGGAFAVISMTSTPGKLGWPYTDGAAALALDALLNAQTEVTAEALRGLELPTFRGPHVSVQVAGGTSDTLARLKRRAAVVHEPRPQTHDVETLLAFPERAGSATLSVARAAVVPTTMFIHPGSRDAIGPVPETTLLISEPRPVESGDVALGSLSTFMEAAGWQSLMTSPGRLMPNVKSVKPPRTIPGLKAHRLTRQDLEEALGDCAHLVGRFTDGAELGAGRPRVGRLEAPRPDGRNAPRWVFGYQDGHHILLTADLDRLGVPAALFDGLSAVADALWHVAAQAPAEYLGQMRFPVLEPAPLQSTSAWTAVGADIEAWPRSYTPIEALAEAAAPEDPGRVARLDSFLEAAGMSSGPHASLALAARATLRAMLPLVP